MHEPTGYRYGDPTLPRSPVTLEDLRLLQAALLFGDDDVRALRRAGEVLAPQVEEILDLWYGFVGSNPHLVATFAGPDGQPDAGYLAGVRARFGRWIRDLCERDLDEAWLDYQHEIGLRHHATKKGQTDGIATTSHEVPMRYMIAFVVPITVTIRPFLEKGARDAAELDAMHQAWFKAVTLSAALWCRPYAPASW